MDKRSIRKKLETEELEKIILRYLVVVGMDIEISDAFLFGSYAKGEAKADSDIDLCVISPDFGKDEIEEGQYLFKKKLHPPLFFFIFCISPNFSFFFFKKRHPPKSQKP